MEDNPKIIYKKSLDNLGVSFEPIFINKSLEDGLADLVKSAQNDAQEACWLYVHDESRWYNLAFEEELEEEDKYSIGVVTKILILKNKKVSHYHTHPKNIIQKDVDKTMKKRYKLNPQWDSLDMAIEKLGLQKSNYIQNIFPSGIDISMFIANIQKGLGNIWEFGVVSQNFTSHTEIDPDIINTEIEQIYRASMEGAEKYMAEYMSAEVAAFMTNEHDLKLAEETCRRLNTIPGLSIKIREH
ncbi:MAG: hypothetical protein WC852_04340 [Candidatus Nanoarchaeia archaeon]|jgi:hypothetical protein